MLDRRKLDSVQAHVDAELQYDAGMLSNDPGVTSSDWIAFLLETLVKRHNWPHTGMDEIYRSFVKAAAVCIMAAAWAKRE